jgi:formylglycine-generating enzyme required for sulfatase activity
VKLGSPSDEPGRAEDEGPQASVKIDPIWVGKTEITWSEYKTYMGLYKIFKDSKKMTGVRKVDASNRADAVTAPTPLYEPTHTFEFGEEPEQPAVSMTQYAAKQYTKWLSGMTGVQYRIPTEAEWEYAARGNTTSPYSFGTEGSQLEEYAHFESNSPEGAAKVGSKKPNSFGLHDMHGNVWEWTIDGYSKKGFSELGDGVKSMEEAIQWPAKSDSRVVRGGGWQDPADRCRSAARMRSEDEDWKGEDPNSPLSPWWYTTDPARSVGMRLVRSAKPLPKDLITKFWEYDHEDIEADVEFRIEEGRGALGLPTPELAAEIKANQ